MHALLLGWSHLTPHLMMLAWVLPACTLTWHPAASPSSLSAETAGVRAPLPAPAHLRWQPTCMEGLHGARLKCERPASCVTQCLQPRLSHWSHQRLSWPDPAAASLPLEATGGWASGSSQEEEEGGAMRRLQGRRQQEDGCCLSHCPDCSQARAVCCQEGPARTVSSQL